MSTSRVLSLLVLLATSAGVTAPLAAQERDELVAALAVRSVTDDDFVRTSLFSWTSDAQARRLATERRLLTTGAAGGASRSPYQRSLDALIASEASHPDDAALARLLTESPLLGARRYAWATPYGTVLPRGVRSYGPALVHIVLEDDAWHARFAPDERPAFRVVDARGVDVPVADVLAAPGRLASVLHVRPLDAHGAYREVIVHGAVRCWSVGTAEVRERIEEDRRLLVALDRALALAGARRRPPPMIEAWRVRVGDHGDPSSSGAWLTELRARWAATMPFDTSRHALTRTSLAALAETLALRGRHVVTPVEDCVSR